MFRKKMECQQRPVELVRPDNHELFLDACTRSDVNTVTSILKNGFALTDYPSLLYEVLSTSCSTQNVQLLRALIDGGLDVNAPIRNPDDDVIVDYPIVLAVSKLPVGDDNFSAVFAMVEAGCDVNATKSLKGRQDRFCDISALSIAIGRNFLTLVSYLIDHGADINLRLKHTSGCVHRLAFDVAMINPVRPMIALLLERGADVNYSHGVGYSPLHLAAYYCNPDLARMLLAAGADPKADDKYGTPVLHYVFLRSPNPASSRLPIDQPRTVAMTCQMYLTEGVKFDDLIRQNFRDLMLGNTELITEIVELLLDAGADPNNETCCGLTAGHVVTCGDKARIYSLLLKHGWDLSAADSSGQTALHHLALSNHLDSIRFLVENGGDLTQKDDRGRNVLHHTAAIWHLPQVSVLRENLRETHTIREFTDAKYKVIKYMLDLDLDVNVRDRKGASLLDLLAASPLYSGIVRELLWEPNIELAKKIKGPRYRNCQRIVTDLNQAGAASNLQMFLKDRVPIECACQSLSADRNLMTTSLVWEDGSKVHYTRSDPQLPITVKPPGLNLKGWAVYCIRACLQKAAPGYSIFPKIEELPLPETVRKQINLAELAMDQELGL